jgi:YD repeat-containing protein
MEMCDHGFHFCPVVRDVFNYYLYTKDIVVIEIEILGSVAILGDKGVTDKMKVLRVVPKEEYGAEAPTLVYDERGNVVSENIRVCSKFENGLYTYEYDERNNMTRKTLPNGVEWVYEYDEGNRMTRQTCSNRGTECEYAYNERGNMISKTSSHGTLTFEYDERNNLISESSSGGNAPTTHKYDERNNRISTDRNGSFTTCEYDERDNKISETDGSGHKSVFGYDDQNRRVSSIYGPYGDTYLNRYDEAGNLVFSSTPRYHWAITIE